MSSGIQERTIGVVGLGRMGAAMVERLIEVGYRVVGYDIDSARVAQFTDESFVPAGSPSAVAQEAAVVLVSVFDGDQLMQVCTADDGGLLDTIPPDRLIVDTSTVEPAASQLCAERCHAAGAGFLRSTVSGNPGVVRRGGLGIYCSGREEDYRRAAEVLDHLSERHVYVGSGEEARYIKLFINLMVAGTNVLLTEALGLAEAAGIDPDMFIDSVQGSVIGSAFTAYKGQALSQSDYSVTMTPQDIRKDLGYTLHAARHLGVSVPSAAVIDQVYAATEEAGYGHLDFGATLLLHQASRARWRASRDDQEKNQ